MILPPTGALRESDLQAGQRVVYPNQGVCRIVGIELKEIGGHKSEFLTMKREEDGATVMVPRAKLAAIGLRHLAQPDEVQQILAFFEAESGDPELDWKVRHRTHADKMTDGSLTGTAEVLKALHSLAERRPLPQKERELYDSARHLVVHEVAVALGVPLATGEDTVDFALTPPAGSSRAAEKAKLKADREAAEEAALLDGLDDLGDLEVELPADLGAAESEAALVESGASVGDERKSPGPGSKRRGLDGAEDDTRTPAPAVPKPKPKPKAKSKSPAAPKKKTADPPNRPRENGPAPSPLGGDAKTARLAAAKPAKPAKGKPAPKTKPQASSSAKPAPKAKTKAKAGKGK